MSGTVFTVVGFLIGAMILGAGVYYYLKNKEDMESRKIYGITGIIGAAIVVGMAVKVMVAGF